MSKACCLSLLIIMFLTVHQSQGAEFEAHPSIAVSEEFTDNVFETNTNRTSDYITRVQPGIALNYQAPSLSGNLGYQFDYRHYARKNREDEVVHSLSTKARLIAVEKQLFLDVSDEFQRVSLDTTRDVTKESLFVNQSDRNVVTVSPSLLFHPSERIMVKTGYLFVDTRYFSSSAFDKNDHIGSLDMAYELTKRVSLTAGYTFTRELADIDNFNQHSVLGGFRYEYADTSFVFAQAGNTRTTYDSGHRLSRVVWNAGMTHVFKTLTGTLTTGVKYNEDPSRNIMQESFVTGVIENKYQRGVIRFSPYYSEYLQTEKGVLDTKKYGTLLQGTCEMLTNLTGRLAFTAEKYEQPLNGSYTRRFLVDSALSYLLAERLVISLMYTYVDYYSPGIAADNRHVNRGIVEIKKTF